MNLSKAWNAILGAGIFLVVQKPGQAVCLGLPFKFIVTLVDAELQLHLATFFSVLHATNLIFQMEKRDGYGFKAFMN